MTYRELQTALKNLRNAGYDVQVKLNASFDTLQAEYNRLIAIASQDSLEQPQPQQVMTTDSFNKWVGLPYKQTTQQPSCENERATKQPLEQLEVPPDGNITLQLGGNIWQTSKQLHNSPRALIHEEIGRLALVRSRVDLAYPTNLPKNELYNHQENSQSFVEQEFKAIQVEPREQYPQTAFESPESLPRNTLAISPNDSPNIPYWIDGSQLGQNLEYTLAQALRNLEDGINWLKRLPARLKAFEQGFREGLRDIPTRQQASLKQPHVIPIERSYRPPKPLTMPLAA